ncbi:MAG: hypothetical protein KKD69_03420 [Euryarchaeota archaeon]|nr:hypothetical protein [Euryarchaeota archaeon]MCG2727027.1 hypothetical protein [Candidatus Methanoperedenaceae archaeon]
MCRQVRAHGAWFESSGAGRGSYLHLQLQLMLTSALLSVMCRQVRALVVV